MGEVSASSSKHHMIGGDGPNSYARNSAYQKELLVSAEDLVRELILKHVDTDLETFRIAELGCSVGPNALLAVDNIIGAVEKRCGSTHHVPEFQVFFNDLIGNDFNTLFKLLPPSRNYLAAAAPGSFHGRLFPRGSIHLAHCSTALHWLSAAPEEPNKGRIHYSGAGKEVRDAYRVQYERDMDAFLSARAHELVPGGLMLLLLIGFPDGYLLASDSNIGHAFHTLGSCLYEMANMGKIGEEEVDSFNLPFYYPTRTEVEAVIVANGVFNVERVAEMAAPMRRDPDPASVVSHMRAVVGVLVEERFGSGIVEDLFQLHLNKLLESPILDHTHHKETIYFLFLKRKKAFS